MIAARAALPVEPVEPQRVREEPRDPAREAVELRQRVLAQRDEHVDTRGAAEQLPGVPRRRTRAGVVRVIEEVLLGLVEDEVHVSAAGTLSASRGAVRGRAARLAPPRRAQLGIVAPAREHDDERLLRQLSQRARDRGAQQRRLADPARAVEHRQPRGDQVGDDDLPLALAAEEQERVELGVVERAQALVRARSARLRSRGLQPPLEQLDVGLGLDVERRDVVPPPERRASGLGERCTAHDR